MENKTRERLQIEQQIVYNFVQIIELFPQYSVAQHLSHILRKKGETKDPYFWDDKFILKKFEQYYDELKQDLASLSLEDENF